MNAPKRAASTSLVDAAYEQIRRRILDNAWPPGHRALEQEVAKLHQNGIRLQAESHGKAYNLVVDQLLVATGRVAVSDQNVTLKSATVGRKLSGGLNPKTDAAAVEFGADHGKVTYQATNRQGTTYNVTRNTRAQLRPRKSTGYVVYPAAASIIPRIASLWIQTTARTIYDMLDGRR
jgi:hypothetical protein